MLRRRGARLGQRRRCGSPRPALGWAVCRPPTPRCSSPRPPRPAAAPCWRPGSSRSCGSRRSTRTPSSRRPRRRRGAARGGATSPCCWPGPRPRTSSRRWRSTTPTATWTPTWRRHPRARVRLGARARRRGARQAGRRRRGRGAVATDARDAPGCCTPGTGWSTCATPTPAAPAAWWAARRPRRCTSPTSTTPRSRPTSPPASRLRVAGAFTLDGLGGPYVVGHRGRPEQRHRRLAPPAARAGARARRRVARPAHADPAASRLSHPLTDSRAREPARQVERSDDTPRADCGLRRVLVSRPAQTGGTSRRLSAKCRSRWAA